MDYVDDDGRPTSAKDQAYARAFLELGIDIDRMAIEEAAALIRPRRSVR